MGETTRRVKTERERVQEDLDVATRVLEKAQGTFDRAEAAFATAKQRRDDAAKWVAFLKTHPDLADGPAEPQDDADVAPSAPVSDDDAAERGDEEDDLV